MATVKLSDLQIIRTFTVVPVEPRRPNHPAGPTRRGGRLLTVDEIAARGGNVKLKVRRDDIRSRGLCINGPADPSDPLLKPNSVTHGPVVRGGKCQHCINVHKRVTCDCADCVARRA